MKNKLYFFIFLAVWVFLLNASFASYAEETAEKATPEQDMAAIDRSIIEQAAPSYSLGLKSLMNKAEKNLKLVDKKLKLQREKDKGQVDQAGSPPPSQIPPYSP